MTVVTDASVVVAALVTGGQDGAWAEDLVLAGSLTAPHLLPVEVMSHLRRLAAAGQMSAERALVALADLVRLPIRYVEVAGLTDRIWALRNNVTPYDAWYVALAEVLDAPLATLDQRLVRASGPRCRFVTP